MIIDLTWPNRIVAALLIWVAATGLVHAAWHLRKQTYTERFYGVFLLAFSLALCYRTAAFAGLFLVHPNWMFFPVYLTLGLGPLLFYFCKSYLFPEFRLRRKDSKHFIMAFVQFGVFLFAWLSRQGELPDEKRYFFSSFYGQVQELTFIVLFFLYLYFSYRFARYKTLHPHTAEDPENTLELKRFLKSLLMIYWLYATYVLTDIVSFRILGINLYDKANFSYFGELSFALFVWWSCRWGRKGLPPVVPAPAAAS